MKKLLCLVLSIVMLMGMVIPASAMGMGGDEYYVQLVHTIWEKEQQFTDYYKTVEEALAKAENGDIIEIFKDLSLTSAIVIPDGLELTIVSGTQREVRYSSGIGSFVYTDQNAPKKTLKKTVDGAMFTLGNGSKVTFENLTLDADNKAGEKGGIIFADNNSTLISQRGVVLKNSKLGNNSFGGAIYAAKASTVSVEKTTFTNNTASTGKDIYAEVKEDIALKGSISADIGYGDQSGADINAVNLMLHGEIGLIFHVVVPDKYIDGSIWLKSRTGEEKSLKIAECLKDDSGRYLAEYNVSAIELSEGVTAIVYDKNGIALTTKTKSVEQYGCILLDDEETTEREKDVIIKLLNYGHFSQLECADCNGWEIGKDYAETMQYCDLTCDTADFESYAPMWVGTDEKVKKISFQLSLDYITDINIYIPSTEKPIVDINQEKDVQVEDCGDGRYKVVITGIYAMNLDRENTIVINGNVTITMSALSYCYIAAQGDDIINQNSIRALYEFYLATLKFSEK